MQREAGLPEEVVQRTLTANSASSLRATPFHRQRFALGQVPESQICFSRTQAFVGIGAVALVSLALVGGIVTALRRR